MPLLKTLIDSRSPEFGENAEHLRKQVADLDAQLERVSLGGGEATAIAIELP